MYICALVGGSGTGKSTHILLWRQRFGERGDIINGDKLFLRRLNEYGITREELEDAWTSCTQMQRSEE